MKGDLEAIDHCIQKGIPVDGTDATKKTALMCAAWFQHERAVKKLVDCGADVHYAQPPHGTTALQYATQAGNAAVVAALLGAGADVNAADGHGETALGIACEAQNEDVVEQLLAVGANVNQPLGGADVYKSTHLIHAVRHGTAPIVALLLQAGADVHDVDGGHYSALMRACAHGSAEMCELLLSAGADINYKMPLDCSTCLHIAVRCSADVVALVQTLLARAPTSTLSLVAPRH